MEDLQNGAAAEIQSNDLRGEGEEEVIGAVEDVNPEVEVSLDEKDLSFAENGSTGEEEADEVRPPVEIFEEAGQVSDLVFEAVEPVQSSSEAVTSMDAEDETNESSTVVAEVEQHSSSSMDLPEAGSVLPLVEVACEEFQESTLSNADENSKTAPVERDVDLEGTDKINGQDLDDKTQENAENSELEANGNDPQVEASNGNYTAAETPKTTTNPPAISVTKRTSFLGCCGFFEVLRRSDR